MFWKYPSLGKLSERRQILEVPLVVGTEKLDGTNFSLWVPRGLKSASDIIYGSRDYELGMAGSQLCDGFFEGKPVAWFASRPALLDKLLNALDRRGLHEVILFGESCGSNIQTGVMYLQRHEVMFRAFNLLVDGEFLNYDLFCEICDEAGLPRVPEIYRGKPSLEVFNSFLEKPSVEASRNSMDGYCDISEGVIFSADPLIRNPKGQHLIIKHKSVKFQECCERGKAANRDRLAPTVLYAHSVATAGRLHNVRGHLRGQGIPFRHDLKDLRHVSPAMLADIHKECQEGWDALEAAGFLYKEIDKAVKAQIAEAYSAVLLEEQLPVIDLPDEVVQAAIEAPKGKQRPGLPPKPAPRPPRPQ